MNRLRKLRFCDVALAVVTIAILASGVQLEVTSGSSIAWVWIHIILGAMFSVLIVWHLQLHFKWSGWLKKLKRQRFANTRWLAVAGVLTLLTGLIATAGWIVSPEHSKIGAVHGKLGFLLAGLAIWHTAKRIRFFRV